jgi:hypothetical protein
VSPFPSRIASTGLTACPADRINFSCLLPGCVNPPEMMKVTAFVGSARRKHTYDATRLFLDKLEEFGGVETASGQGVAS